MKKSIFLVLLCLAFIRTAAQSYNPVAIGGNITLPTAFYNVLVAEQGLPGSPNSIKIELWAVNFLKKSNDANQKLINFNQKVESIFNYSTSTNGSETIIKYTFKGNIPATGELAVLIYSNNVPTGFQTIDVSKVLPQAGTGNLVKYNSNVKQKAGITTQNWGLFCLGKYITQGNEELTCNFTVKGLTGKEIKTLSLFGDIVDTAGDVLNGAKDFVEDTADVIFDGGIHVAGIVINAAGSIVIQAGMIVYNVIVYNNFPKVRVMSQQEYDWANRKIFGNTLPPRTSIFITNLMSVNRRAFTIPNGIGLIYLNIGDAYDNPMAFMRSNEIPGQVFIHELTHVWEIEHNPLLKTAAQGTINQYKYTVLDNKGVYNYNCGSRWTDYNFEQQAKITETAYVNNENNKFTYCERDYVVNNIRFGQPFQFQNPPLVGKISSLSRVIANMEVFTIRNDGSIWTNYFYEGNNPAWNSLQVAPPNSASPRSKIAVTSRNANTMEIFWIAPNGGVMHAFWYSSDSKWNVQQIAPAGSANAEGGSITAVSRQPNTMEIFWGTNDQKIICGYWYDGQPTWKTYELAPAGSLSSFGNNLTCVSRQSNTIELIYIGTAGKVMVAYWYEGQQGYKTYEMAPAGSADIFSGITCVSRGKNTIEAFWVTPAGGIKDGYWYEGQSGYKTFDLAPAGSAFAGKNIYAATGISAVARKTNTMELFWIGPRGQIKNAYWYEGQNGWRLVDVTNPGTADLASGVKVISRGGNTMEVFWEGPGGTLEDAYWYEGQQGWKVFRMYPVKP